MTSSYNIPCRIDRRADYQGSRPSAAYQAEVGKTGCSGLSPLTRSGTKTDVPSVKSLCKLSYSNIKVATINVRTLQDDMKLFAVVEAAKKCKINVLTMQRDIEFDDEPI